MFGCIISRSARSVVSIEGAEDHLDIPPYPRTTREGVGHFVHYGEPLICHNTPKKEVGKIMLQLMSKVYPIYAQYMLYLTYEQVQWSTHHLNFRSSTFNLFHFNGPETQHKTWHRSFKCSGILHCEYAHEDIIRVCPEYSSVELKDINKFRRTHTGIDTTITQKISENTQDYYNACKEAWDITGPCTFKETNGEAEMTCAGQMFELFTRNGVGRFVAYTKHMYRLC